MFFIVFFLNIFILPETKEAATNKKSTPKSTPKLITSWRGNYGGIRNPSHRLTNYYGPYPQITLESARFELLKLIDMREGHGYNNLKMKLGIYPDGTRDVNFDGWGDASDYFSCSGEPEEYLQDFEFDPSFSRRMNESNTHSNSFANDVTSADFNSFTNSPKKKKIGLNSKGQRKSAPVATVTSDDRDRNDTETTSSDSSSDTSIDAKEDNNNRTDSNSLDAEITKSGTTVAEEHQAESKSKDRSEEATAGRVESDHDSSVASSSGTSQFAETVVKKPETNVIVDNGKNMIVSAESSSTEITKRVIDKPETGIVHDNENNESMGSTKEDDMENTLNSSVIILENDEKNTAESSPIVIDESFIEAGVVDNATPSNNANSPVEIIDSTDSCEEIQPNGREVIIDLADSTVSDSSGTLSEDGSSRLSLKRKHVEMEAYELEDGEIISSDEDNDDVQYVGKSQPATSKSIDEPKPKKQNVSNSKFSVRGKIDTENNTQGPSFMIDRTPTSVNEPHLDRNRNFDDNAHEINKMTSKQGVTIDIVVEEDEINANITEPASNLAESEVLENKYKCDYCPTISANGVKMLKHLKNAKHYSSSFVLVNKNGKPVLIDQKSGQICHKAAFGGPIPICPEPYCFKVFKDIYSCVFHYNSAHNKNERAYALSELLGEDVILCEQVKSGEFECEVCGAQFMWSTQLFEHRKKENHITIDPRSPSQTVFLCRDCNEVFYNLNDILRHRIKSTNHCKEVRVLHISFTRVKKKLLPFSVKPVAGLSAVENEIRYLQALTVCNTTKRTRRQITGKIRDLSKSLK